MSYFENYYTKPKKRWRLSKNARSILITVVALLVIGAVVSGLVSLFRSETQEVHIGYSIGALDETTGKAIKNESAIYTKKTFECKGLTVKLDLDSNINYQVFYYDALENFICASTVYTESGAINVPAGAKLARVVIMPEWDEEIKEEDRVISFFDITKYSSQLKLFVDVNQEGDGNVKVYIVPGDAWNEDRSIIGAWLWSENSTAYGRFVMAEDVNEDGIYEVTIPSGYTNFIFVDLKAGANDLGENWSNVRARTGDMGMPEKAKVYYHVYASTWTDSADIVTITTPDDETPDETSRVVTLTPSDEWAADGSSYAIYYWNDTDTVFAILTTEVDGTYEFELPEGYTNYLFVDLKAGATVASWENVRAQTDDFVLE